MALSTKDLRYAVDTMNQNIKYFNALAEHFAKQGHSTITLNAKSVQSVVQDLTSVASRLSAGLDRTAASPPAAPPRHPRDEVADAALEGG